MAYHYAVWEVLIWNTIVMTSFDVGKSMSWTTHVGMVSIAPTEMLITGGWFMFFLYPMKMLSTLEWWLFPQELSWAPGSGGHRFGRISTQPLTGLVEGKSTGNQLFFPSNMKLSCKFSLAAVQWRLWFACSFKTLNCCVGDLAYIPNGISSATGESKKGILLSFSVVPEAILQF